METPKVLQWVGKKDDKSVEQRAALMDILLVDLKVYTMAVSMVVERVDSKVESWEIRLDYQTADMMVGWTVYSLAEW